MKLPNPVNGVYRLPLVLERGEYELWWRYQGTSLFCLRGVARYWYDLGKEATFCFTRKETGGALRRFCRGGYGTSKTPATAPENTTAAWNGLRHEAGLRPGDPFWCWWEVPCK